MQSRILSRATALAAVALILSTSVVWADQVVNDIDTVIDPSLESRTITAGGSTSVGFFVRPSNTIPAGDANGCNATGANPATVTLSVPAGVTVSPTSLTFTDCGIVQSSTFTAGTPGTYTIGVATVSGGKSGSSWDTAPATFSLVVNPPADSTPPVITPTVTGTVGNGGWYTSNVTVTWSVVDNESSISASSGCGATTISADTAGTTLTCSATSAGGSSSQSVTIKRDATPPSASASASPAPDGAGWNNSDVTVTFTGNDALSGIDACTAPTILSSEDAGQFASGTCTDNAGNVSDPATASGINIDKTGPAITPNVVGTPGKDGWYISDVTVTWSVTDGVSPVSLGTGCGPTTISSDTAGTTLTCNATSAGGSATESVTIKRDATAPTATATPDRAPNANGWYKADVTVSFDGSDDLSGIDSCSADVALGEGANQSESGTCTDKAGNESAPATASGINIDKTAPTLSGAPTTDPNTNGWHHGDAIVQWTAADGLSGLDLATVPADSLITGEGSNLGASASVADLAGNTASASVAGIAIDRTAPTATAGADRQPNLNGWYNADVTVSFDGEDSLSGIDFCSPDVVLSTEGAGQSVSGTCTDRAGNASAPAPAGGINIDKTAPTIAAAATTAPNANNWYAGDVVVEFTCSDALSGIPTGACPPDELLTIEGKGVVSSAQTVIDAAGNTSASSNVVTVNIDKTAPTASASAAPAPNAFGWNNSDVTVSFSGDDSTGSGVDFCDAPIVLSSEGAWQSASGTCTDKAGNESATATASGINIDKTNPAVSLVGGPANGGDYYFGFVPVAPTCSASDALSGLAGACAVSGYGTTIGSHTVTADATDKADNSASASATYSVNHWSLFGFYRPVDMDGVYNVVKGGSTVPLKFEVFAGPTELTSTSVVKSFVQTRITCGTDVVLDEIEVVSTGGTSLRYDSIGGQFIQNWQTPKLPGQCYKVTMTTQDDYFLSAYFKLK